MQKTLFVDVVLPLPVPKLYTYRIPFNLNDGVKTGIRVLVKFGRNKLYTAIIRNIHETPPKEYEAKYIESVLDEEPVVNEKQLVFWEWIASYYMCNIGEVMNAALPGGMKMSSESRVVLNPAFDKNYSGLNDKEFMVVEALELNQVLALQEISQIIDQKTVYPVVRSLLEKSAILVEEEIREKFKPKVESFIRLSEKASNEAYLRELFDKLETKAPKQLEVLMAVMTLSRTPGAAVKAVKKSEVLKKSLGAESAIGSLIRKGILEIFSRETGRLEDIEVKYGYSKKLNEFQQGAYEKITAEFDKKDVVLLHGVTSSGKTEIYIKLIEKTLAEGKQVLYLLPEIALTAQIIERLGNILGDKAGVYHSKYNENERVEVWQKLIGKKKKTSPETGQTFTEGLPGNSYSVILGARSALFLPFDNLGLIIVDEEHESSFKQFEPAPRYHARDAALVLAHFHGAKTLLGSATPSIESYHNALSGKYGFVELLKRFGGVQMPEIFVADIKEANRKKLMKSHYSPLLLESINFALENKEQVILFQNRRGFAPQMQCNICGWAPQCTRCDVSLTYHKNFNQLKCHYCGYSQKPNRSCNACGSPDVKMKGFGTEKIEDELAIFFPNARVARLDLDTTRGKNAHRQIIHSFEEHQVDILVGTQMVTKGLDFDNVGLVGILSAESMLQFPDFRANERSFQLMAQVSGRAGRKNKRGKVIIQAYNPEHPILKNVIANDYLSMYTWEMMERKNFYYPPFYRLIAFTLRNKDIDVLNEAANYFADLLKQQLGNRVLGPEFPLVARIRNLYNKKILLKIEKEASISSVKKQVQDIMTGFSGHKDYKSVRVITDIDPL